MTKIKKILCPIDLSGDNKGMGDYVRLFANYEEVEVILLHVFPEMRRYLADFGVSTPEEMGNVMTKLSENTLVKTKAMVEEFFSGLNTRFITVEAVSPADKIVEVAKKEQVDLIIMGNHGRSGFSRLLLGSVSAGVLQLTGIPVLVVPTAGRV